MHQLNPDSLMTPVGAYSQGVASGGWVFVAGQTGVDANLKVPGDGGMEAQTRQALANVEAVLKAAGATLSDVVSTTVYVTDFADYAAFDAAYRDCFGDHRPARATVCAELVAPQLLVEIQATAIRRSNP